MIQEIKFNPVSQIAQTSAPYPKPSREYTPKWYKDLPPFANGNTDHITLKMCKPFSDVLSFGYMQESWEEITVVSGLIEKSNSVASKGLKMDVSFSIPEEYGTMEFTWHPCWIPELPEGYSALITHPLNRVDLPFYTLSGIIEHDRYTQSAPYSNFPFLIKKDFSGIIPIGTPMYQIIPFKRDDWESKVNQYDKESQYKTIKDLFINKPGGYKKLHWLKKNFK
jgi:hypothetical protein